MGPMAEELSSVFILVVVWYRSYALLCSSYDKAWLIHLAGLWRHFRGTPTKMSSGVGFVSCSAFAA